MMPWLLLAVPAWAWHVDDHRRLTEAAVDAVVAEHPVLASQARRVVHGSVLEDLDLVAKWSRWSHYDKPTGEVRGRRRRSGERVDQLWSRAAHDLDDGRDRRAWRRVGRIVHQVQDMAVPAHVVPVQHGPWDGFERASFVVPAFGGPLVAGNPAEVHAAVAMETWTASRSEPWSALWTPRAGRFGRYGDERFGDRGERAAFVDDRVQSAISGTVAVLVFVAERSEGRSIDR